jgi:hypothetical protein
MTGYTVTQVVSGVGSGGMSGSGTATATTSVQEAFNEVMAALDKAGGCIEMERNPRSGEYTTRPCKHR